MPPAIIVGAALATGAAAAAAVITGTAITAAALATTFVTTLVVGGLSAALAPKPKQGALPFTAEARDRLQIVRSPVATRRVVYGQVRVSGPLIYATSTGAEKEYMHLVIALAGHECQEIGDVYFDDEVIGALDGSGNVTTGRFAGFARIKKYLGAAGQTSDADLQSDSGGEWTVNATMTGVCYLYARLKFDPDVFPTGLPNISAVVKGKKLYDPRDSGTRWSNNPALVARDYLTNTAYGLGIDAALVPDASVNAAANVCDERVAMAAHTPAFTADAGTDVVTFAAANYRIGSGDGVTVSSSGTLPGGLSGATPYYVWRLSDTTCKLATSYANALAGIFINITSAGSGTHTMSHVDQPRYLCDGTVDLANRPIDIVRTLASSMAGAVVFSQGSFLVHAGAYDTPTVTLTENDLRGPVEVAARAPRKDLFNGVRGTYVEPWKLWQPTDFFAVTNPTYEGQDGSEQILRDIELPYTTNQTRAQRIAKVTLERHRQPITVRWPGKMTCFRLRPWDTVQVTVAHLGWSSKVFRVTDWELSDDGGVDLLLKEEASAVYNWSAGAATLVDPAPDTNLPALTAVEPPTAVTINSGGAEVFVAPDGTVVTRLLVEWTASADAFVSSYEVQWKRTADSVWTTQVVGKDVTDIYLQPAEAGVDYDVRVRAVNVAGVRSAFDSDTTNIGGKTNAPGAATSLAAAGVIEGVSLSWANPSDADLSYVEVYRHTSDVRASASKIAEVDSNRWTDRTGTIGVNYWYWVRTVDTSGNVGDWNASGGTLGVPGAVGTTAISDGAVTEVKIGDLAVTNAKINNLAVTAAKIGDAEVSTLKIAGNAATLPIATYTDGLIVHAFGIGVVATGTITVPSDASSQPVIVQFSVTCDDNASGGGPMSFIIRRNTTRIAPIGATTYFTVEVPASGQQQLAVAVSDTPGAGTFTYDLYHVGIGAGMGARHRSTVLLLAKR